MAALAVAVACAGDPDRTPRPTSLEPTWGDPEARTAVLIHGEAFYVTASVSAAGPSGDTVDTRYRAWVGEVELTEVRWVDGRTLSAVVPAGLPLGPHDVVVESAAGRRGTLAGGFRVAYPAPDLRATAAFDPPSPTVGQAVSLLVTVTNDGTGAARGVTATPALSGPGALTALATPSPMMWRPAPRPSSGSATGRPWPAPSPRRSRSGGPTQAGGRGAGAARRRRRDGGRAGRAGARLRRRPGPGDGGPGLRGGGERREPGQAAAQDVVTSIAASGGAGSVVPGAAPAAAGLAAGASASFRRSFTASGAGAVTLRAAAEGTDANAGLTVSGGPVTATVVVQAPAALQASLAVPASIPMGEFTATMTVTNPGGAAATAVVPGALTAAAGNTATIALVASPTGPLEVPGGGGEAIFQWVYRVTSAGTVALQGSASGQDANSGAALATGTVVLRHRGR